MAGPQKDFVRNRLSFFVFWVLPPTAMIAVTSAGTNRGQVTVVWTVSLLVMSVGCFVNAIRSGRLHCAVTGPFFLLMALASLLYGLGIISLGSFSWGLIGAVTVLGGLVLTYLPERLWGKYLGR